ncbi:LytR C-terminal domain-containing protein [Nocardioides sp. Kera G14]|uniref:LytR C-terminal domain-containing protein n=1 Tax=Nocardioides sp. Kera G14 TaxID=2884264 RepID=UPI001D129368|nr:LytR C-terminal domain-containing protein [Nocardioides sp. Kera G14]UDY24205.1 LytR C-terminal domain-containing protein [Nocardioides sp. Kera G14]
MTRHTQRGVVLPSPVVLLSILAVVMAAIAFVVTRGGGDDTVDIPTTTISSTADPSGPASDSQATSTPTVAPPATTSAAPKPLNRKKYQVVVFNNTSIHGLAATVSDQVEKAGWTVVGADNWYGSIPKTTVYYPADDKDAAKQLALDLGIKRTAPAEKPMSTSRLTIILTGPLK